MLPDLSVDSEADNAFASKVASTHTTASPTRECIWERNGERNGSTQLAGDPIAVSQPTCTEYWQCKEQNGVEFGLFLYNLSLYLLGIPHIGKNS